MKTMRQNLSRRAGRSAPRNQRGVVLIIALIVLVSMTLAAIGMSRSVDTANMVAGNMGFKQATIQSSDLGIQAATAWLSVSSGGTTLQNDSVVDGYYSSAPGAEPNWEDLGAWTGAVRVNGGVPDAAGNVTRYMIHRMCTQPNTAYNGVNAGTPNSCAVYLPAGTTCEGCSMAVGASQFAGQPQIYYRITTRVDGPHDTISVIQVNVLLQV
jgi:type IV pilus assembly protein PilX